MYIFPKVINSFIRRGNKQRIENYIHLIFKKIKQEVKRPVYSILSRILKNCLLMVELKHPLVRHKKKKYPYFVSFNRMKRLTVKTIMKSVKKKDFQTLKGKLFHELKDAYYNKGIALEYKKQIYNYTDEIFPIIDKFGKPISKKRRSINRS